jgi:hypothetical protein
MLIAYGFVFKPILMNADNKDSKQWKYFSDNINSIREIFYIVNALDPQ